MEDFNNTTSGTVETQLNFGLNLVHQHWQQFKRWFDIKRPLVDVEQVKAGEVKCQV